MCVLKKGDVGDLWGWGIRSGVTNCISYFWVFTPPVYKCQILTYIRTYRGCKGGMCPCMILVLPVPNSFLRDITKFLCFWKSVYLCVPPCVCLFLPLDMRSVSVFLCLSSRGCVFLCTWVPLNVCGFHVLCLSMDVFLSVCLYFFLWSCVFLLCVFLTQSPSVDSYHQRKKVWNIRFPDYPIRLA